MSEKKQLNEQDLEKVSGGSDYGKSYSGKESETIPAGTKVIYTDDIDGEKPHLCTYLRYAGDDFIVLRPDDDECYKFFVEAIKRKGTDFYQNCDNLTAFKVKYTWLTYNHLYKAI